MQRRLSYGSCLHQLSHTRSITEPLRAQQELWQSTLMNFIQPQPIPLDAKSTQSSSASVSSSARLKLIYGLAIFSSAFLLFQVQPLIAKIILPWFGGAAAVWTICLLFFQAVLLLGYLYAHLLTKISRPGTQAIVHSAFLAVSILVLPILPKSSWKPEGFSDPSLHILSLLAFTVGLPYLLLASTSPLLQAWYAQSREEASPYRFYALSNIGSMLALISYPILVEPRFSSTLQARVWSFAYAGVAILCALIGFMRRTTSDHYAETGIAPLPSRSVQLLWVALPACASALLLAITSHISQNIAAVPLIWIVPLSLYLLSFILCFDGRGWYCRNFFLRALGLALASMAYALSPAFEGFPFKFQIVLFCGGLFACSMFCHGELVRLKPHPRYLTRFYLLVSLGGALGAMFVALLAPHLFSWYYEFEIAVGVCGILVLIVNYRDQESPFYKARWQPAWLVVVGLVIALIASLSYTAREQSLTAKLMVRNFYGVLRVVDAIGPNVVLVSGNAAQSLDGDLRFRTLKNGTIDHGLQFLAPNRRRLPTTYYGPGSGVGVALLAAGEKGPLRVGVIGLGAGTLAAYGRAGDRYTFYEINPLDVQIAQQQFTFLQDSGAAIDIVPGDARLSLESESPQGFDVLAVDAFSGDSIPVHLLTREAFELYFRQLNPQGVLAVHTSNQFLDLTPVVSSEAAALNCEAVIVNFDVGDNHSGTFPASWILVGRQGSFIAEEQIEKAGRILPAPRANHLWTDEYSSLFRILK